MLQTKIVEMTAELESGRHTKGLYETSLERLEGRSAEVGALSERVREGDEALRAVRGQLAEAVDEGAAQRRRAETAEEQRDEKERKLAAVAEEVRPTAAFLQTSLTFLSPAFRSPSSFDLTTMPCRGVLSFVLSFIRSFSPFLSPPFPRS